MHVLTEQFGKIHMCKLIIKSGWNLPDSSGKTMSFFALEFDGTVRANSHVQIYFQIRSEFAGRFGQNNALLHENLTDQFRQIHMYKFITKSGWNLPESSGKNHVILALEFDGIVRANAHAKTYQKIGLEFDGLFGQIHV